MKISITSYSVSYTHLDVYKRQVNSLKSTYETYFLAQWAGNKELNSEIRLSHATSVKPAGCLYKISETKSRTSARTTCKNVKYLV